MERSVLFGPRPQDGKLQEEVPVVGFRKRRILQIGVVSVSHGSHNRVAGRMSLSQKQIED